MKKINKKELLEVMKEDKYNVFIFYNLLCKRCTDYLKYLEYHPVGKDFHIINIKEDLLFYFKEIGQLMPVTIITKNEDLVYYKVGNLSGEKLNELLKILEEN